MIKPSSMASRGNGAPDQLPHVLQISKLHLMRTTSMPYRSYAIRRRPSARLSAYSSFYVLPHQRIFEHNMHAVWAGNSGSVLNAWY